VTISANYTAEAQNRAIDINYLIEIDGVSTAFSRKPVIGYGGTVETLITNMRWNPSKITIDSVKTSVGTLEVTLFDPDGDFMAVLAANELHQKEITFYRGFTNLDFADYNALSKFKIYDISSSDGIQVKIKGRDRITDLKEPVTFPRTILTADATDTDTTINVEDTSDFPGGTSFVFANNEKIKYTSKTATTFGGLTRSAVNPQEHDAGDDVHYFFTLEENPITMMLQLMVSPGGGGSYDVLPYGLGLAEAEINVTSFEGVRDDTNLAGNVWKFEFTDEIKDLLAFFEKEIFQFTAARLYIDEDGKIACTAFMEPSIQSFQGDLPEEDIIPLPAVSSNSDRVKNQLRVKYDYDAELGTFRKDELIDETETGSQTDFGVRLDTKIYESRGIRAGLDGSNLADNFAKKYYRRVAQPFGLISRVKTLWKRQFYKPGDKIKFFHSKIYDLLNGAKGISDQFMEIVNSKFDLERGVVTYDVNNSPFLTGNRFGFISPASGVLSGASTTVFTLETGEAARAEWEEDQVIELFDRVTGDKVSGPHTITDVTGEVITVGTAMSVTPGPGHKIRYAAYDEVDEEQKLFAFASDGTNNFGDGEPPYIVS